MYVEKIKRENGKKNQRGCGQAVNCIAPKISVKMAMKIQRVYARTLHCVEPIVRMKIGKETL